MHRARRHRRLCSALAFGLVALAVEVVGRSLTHRLDVGRHVAAPSYADAGYYPVLLAVVKIGIALLLARIAWRAVRARSTERAALRLLGAAGRRPRLRLSLSPRLWLALFALASAIYLVQADADRPADGRWALLAPWLHSSALPVFAVLAVLGAVLWSAVRGWLAEYELYAQETAARALRLAGRPALHVPRPSLRLAVSPRRLFGLAFESRPPPLPAA